MQGTPARVGEISFNLNCFFVDVEKKQSHKTFVAQTTLIIDPMTKGKSSSKQSKNAQGGAPKEDKSTATAPVSNVSISK